MDLKIFQNNVRLFVYNYFIKNHTAPTINKIAYSFGTDTKKIIEIFNMLEKNIFWYLNLSPNKF